MGWFGNSDDDLKKHSDRAKAAKVAEEEEEESEDEEEEEEEDSDDEEGSNTLNIVTTNSDANYNLEDLTKEKFKQLVADCEFAMKNKSILNLEKYGMNEKVNGEYIISFSWEEND